METKNREKTLMIAVGVGIGLYVLNSVLFTPLYNDWADRQKQIADMQKKIADGKEMIDRGPQLEKKWKNMRDNTLSPNLTLAESTMFKAFDMWASTSGVTLQGQKPEKKDSDSDAYQNLEWRADVTGTDATIANFLYMVESSPMGLRVESVELASRDEYGRQLALGLTVSGLILTPNNTDNQ